MATVVSVMIKKIILRGAVKQKQTHTHMSSPSALASKAKAGGSRAMKLLLPVGVVVVVMALYGGAIELFKRNKDVAKALTMPAVEDLVAALSSAVLVVAVVKAGADAPFRASSPLVMLVGYTLVFLLVNFGTSLATGRMQEAMAAMSMEPAAKKIVDESAAAADASAKQKMQDAGLEAPKEPVVGAADGTSTAGESAAGAESSSSSPSSSM